MLSTATRRELAASVHEVREGCAAAAREKQRTASKWVRRDGAQKKWYTGMRRAAATTTIPTPATTALLTAAQPNGTKTPLPRNPRESLAFAEFVSPRHLWAEYSRVKNALFAECRASQHTRSGSPQHALTLTVSTLAALGQVEYCLAVLDEARDTEGVAVTQRTYEEVLMCCVLRNVPAHIQFLRGVVERMRADGVAHTQHTLTRVMNIYAGFGIAANTLLIDDCRDEMLALSPLEPHATLAMIRTSPSPQQALSLLNDAFTSGNIHTPSALSFSAFARVLETAQRTLPAKELTALLCSLKGGSEDAIFSPSRAQVALAEETVGAFDVAAVERKKQFRTYSLFLEKLAAVCAAAGDAAAAEGLLKVATRCGVLSMDFYSSIIRANGRCVVKAHDAHYKRAEALFEEALQFDRKQTKSGRRYVHEALVEMYCVTASLASALRVVGALEDEGGRPTARTQRLIAATYKAAGHPHEAQCRSAALSGTVPAHLFTEEVEREIALDNFAASLLAI